MFHPKIVSTLYIEKDKLTFYPGASNSVQFVYPEDSIIELELADEDALTKELTNFIINNKLVPSSLVFLVSSDLLYEKEIHDEESINPVKSSDQQQDQAKVHVSVAKPQINLEERGRQIQIFLDTVPFEETMSKTYKIEKGIKVVVTNKALIDAIKFAFAHQSFAIESVVPYTMLGKDIASGAMDADVAKKILSKLESIKQLSIFEETEQSMLTGESPAAHHIQMTTKVTSKREFGLIGVFVVLLLVLGYVSYTTLIAPVDEKKIASMSQDPTDGGPTPTTFSSPTPDASASASLVNKQILKLQIAGGTSLQADLLRQQLLAGGFTNVSTKPTNVPATGKAVIIFSTTLSEAAKQIILDEVKKNLLNVTVQTNTLTDFDAVVNL